MTTTILVLLFLLQVISFYFIALLNAKLTKFKDMEYKQEQVISEMEESFSAYLAEIKDENDRLLQELKSTETTVAATSTEPNRQLITKETVPFEVPRSFVSKQLAANSYIKTAEATEKKAPVTIKEKVLFYYNEGNSIDEIAKMLQIGKTEVELFLKFKE